MVLKVQIFAFDHEWGLARWIYYFGLTWACLCHCILLAGWLVLHFRWLFTDWHRATKTIDAHVYHHLGDSAGFLKVADWISKRAYRSAQDLNGLASGLTGELCYVQLAQSSHKAAQKLAVGKSISWWEYVQNRRKRCG